MSEEVVVWKLMKFGGVEVVDGGGLEGGVFLWWEGGVVCDGVVVLDVILWVRMGEERGGEGRKRGRYFVEKYEYIICLCFLIFLGFVWWCEVDYIL